MENDLYISATHSGHVRLNVRLGPGADIDGWIATTVIQLDPGEQLTQVANEIEAALGSDSGSRLDCEQKSENSGGRATRDGI